MPNLDALHDRTCPEQQSAAMPTNTPGGEWTEKDITSELVTPPVTVAEVEAAGVSGSA